MWWFDLVLIYIVKNTSSELLISEMFHYINIFFKELEFEIKPNFSKDKIRPPLVIVFAFLKEMTKSSYSLKEGACILVFLS
jgi:hypothetical protein